MDGGNQTAVTRPRGIGRHAEEASLPRGLVAAAWTDVLRGRGLAENLSFEAAGGDSLSLIRMTLLLEEGCGVPLPLEAFHPRMRPADFVRAIERVLTERAGGEPDGPLVFRIGMRCDEDPAEDAIRSAVAGVARIVPVRLPDWPLFASPGFDIEALVDGLAAQIAQQAGEQPVRLFGYCLGGTLAFAVAKRLVTTGHPVRFVGIIDADARWPGPGDYPLPSPPSFQRMWWAMLRGRLVDHLAWLASFHAASRPGLLRWLSERNRMAWLPQAFASRLTWHMRRDVPREFDHPGFIRLLRPSEPLDAPAFVFRSTEHPVDAPDTLYWQTFCPGVTGVDIPGNHAGIFDPENLPVLCDALARAIRRTLSDAPRDGVRDNAADA